MHFDEVNASELMTDLPEALFVMGPDGEILFINPALTAMTGFLSGDLVGGPVSRLMPTPDRRRVDVVGWLRRWADDPNPQQLRYLNLELATRSGETRLVSVRVSRHADDEAVYFLVLLRDVTEEHEAAAARRHSQLVTNRILAIGGDAVLCLDPDHRISYWNRAAEVLFGYREEEVIGEPLSLLLPEGLASQHETWIDEFDQSADAARLMGERAEVRGRTRDGRIVPLEVAITKTTVEGEILLGAQIRDISERKRAQAELAASEARFRAVFEHAMEAMALLDREGRVLEINRAAQDMLPAYSPDKLLWELDWWGDGVDEAARQRLRAAIEAAE